MVCNPTRSTGSPARTGTHICTKVGGSHNDSLLSPSHLSLEVARQPNVGSYDTETTRYHHGETKEFMGQTSPARQSTGRTCTTLLLLN
jgi:hypothetical protein